MPGQDVNPLLRIARSKPNPPTPQGTIVGNPRAGLDGSQYALSLIPTKHVLSDEGSYFVATNPTIGTGVAHALVSAFSDTAALFAIFNRSVPTAGSPGVRIYLDYMRLILTAASTALVSYEFAVKVDGPGFSRAPSANNVAITPVNVNGDDNTGSAAVVQAFSAGSLTVPASGPASRTVARTHISTGLGIVGDEYILQFGGVDLLPFPGLTAARATDPARLVGHAAPIIIGPQEWCVISRWGLTEATTAPSFEYELAWWER